MEEDRAHWETVGPGPPDPHQSYEQDVSCQLRRQITISIPRLDFSIPSKCHLHLSSCLLSSQLLSTSQKPWGPRQGPNVPHPSKAFLTLYAAEWHLCCPILIKGTVTSEQKSISLVLFGLVLQVVSVPSAHPRCHLQTLSTQAYNFLHLSLSIFSSWESRFSWTQSRLNLSRGLSHNERKKSVVSDDQLPQLPGGEGLSTFCNPSEGILWDWAPGAPSSKALLAFLSYLMIFLGAPPK